jgi:hypothetical protein
MIRQLRIYKIEKSLKDAFDKRFQEHAYRIMRSYNFTFVAMWYSEFDNQVEFIYILEWPDKITMKKQWDAFMADSEWGYIKQKSREQHGEMVLSKLKDQILDGVGWFKNKI